MHQLLNEIKNCNICEPYLPFAPNPVLMAHAQAKIAIIGQAPGTKVHKTGIPWNDPSGVLLRKWMQVDDPVFYNPELFAIVPMGFCYPGKGRGGDLAPRPECAIHWHKPLFDLMPHIKLNILVGSYAQKYYLKKKGRQTLAQTVKDYQSYLPDYLPIPHPSPRNRRWLKMHFWFEQEIVPVMRKMISQILNQSQSESELNKEG